MSEKLRVGILGATGMVGQRFISLSGKSSMVSGGYTCSKPEKRRKNL